MIDLIFLFCDLLSVGCISLRCLVCAVAPSVVYAKLDVSSCYAPIGVSPIASSLAPPLPPPPLTPPPAPNLRPCNRGAIRLRTFLHGLTSKILSSPSSETPLLSGWKRMQTMTVMRAQAPKRKYGPEEERERKRGVEKAMIQLTTYLLVIGIVMRGPV